MKNETITVRPARGLGDIVQTVIHRGLDATPMPAATRAKIKGCGGCGRRREKLNEVGRKVVSFAYSIGGGGTR